MDSSVKKCDFYWRRFTEDRQVILTLVLIESVALVIDGAVKSVKEAMLSHISVPSLSLF